MKDLPKTEEREGGSLPVRRSFSGLVDALRDFTYNEAVPKQHQSSVHTGGGSGEQTQSAASAHGIPANAESGANGIHADSLDAASQRALVERILASNSLKRSARLKDFLSYVSNQALSGRFDQITETQIATEVFGRRSDYDPSSDNVVRVQARLLRQKLAEYFAGEGKDEPFVLEMPKGGYIPFFHSREHRISAAKPAQSAVVPRRWLVLAAGIVVILSALTFWFASQYFAMKPLASAAAYRRLPTLAAGVFQGGATLYVVPDTALVTAEVLTGQHFALEAYAGSDYRNKLFGDPTLRDGKEGFWGYLITRRFTDMFAVGLYGRLAYNHPEHFKQLEVRHPKALELRDFHGKNVILVGSPRSNPWFDAISDSLNFRFMPNENHTGEVIRNVDPKPGEEQFYASTSLATGSGHAYGLVAIFPNPYPPGRVMLVGGTGGPATEAVADVVTTNHALLRLRKAIGQKDLERATHLELVISVHVLGGVPRDWKLVAYRVKSEAN